jgi:hypothetical protein
MTKPNHELLRDGGTDTIMPVVIEILTRMSYIVSVGQKLGLGFSGLYLQTS